ncbi:tubulin beta [Acrasis kona]|uniref:Tubulin beta chain n=1 Tax=Acrasis kona TaxID=1008807 RepID=A0AAW2Z580_9EUKA
MREIVFLQVGQCGNQLGQRYWEVLNGEHNIDRDGFFLKDASLEQKLRTNVYYQEGPGGRQIPRACLLDLEEGALNNLRASSIGGIFQPNNFFGSGTGAGNNFAKGYLTEGAESAEEAMDIIRKEAEVCECMQGFQLVHSLGGGTGSGFGSLLTEKIRDEYNDKIIMTFSLVTL